MRGIMHGRYPDADAARLGDGDLHRLAGGFVPQAAIAVQQGGDRRFPLGARLGLHLHAAAFLPLVIGRDHRDAVAIDAVQVGP